MTGVSGIRFYPQTVKTVPGHRATIYLHGRLSDETSDLCYLFSPLAGVFAGRAITDSFGISYDNDMKLEDPYPGLRGQFAGHLLDWNLERQLVLLDGAGFPNWAPRLHACEGALHRVLAKAAPGVPTRWKRSADLLARWPGELQSVIHMWDDIYWQYFTRDPSELELLIHAHRGNPRVRMYKVELAKEYPDPSNETLEEIV